MITYNEIETMKFEMDMQSWESAQSELFSVLIHQLKPEVIIEVGSWKGVSACIMAELSAPYKTHIHCVDTWLGDAHHFISDNNKLPRDSWGYPQLFHQFLTNVKAAGYADRITPHPMSSSDGAMWLRHKKVTAKLIYIDGDHSVHGCYNDISNYWELLESGGAIFGDDFEIFDGVKSAVLRFVCERNLQVMLAKPFWIIKK